LKKVIISVTNDLSTDQRVDKVANSLCNAGLSVLVVGRRVLNSEDLANRQYLTHRFNMFFNKKFLFYLEYNIRLFFFLLLRKSDILLSNDLDTLCANFLVSKLKQKKLVYDSHELFTETPELLNRPVVKFVWLSLENFFLKRINFAYTVSHSIANFYREKHGVHMSVIPNFPLTKKVHHIMSSKSLKTIIYQGAVNKDRGIDLMIESMVYVNAKLYIVGDGDLMKDMKQYVQKLKLEDKVSFTGKMDFNNLFEITKTADLGLSFEKDTCLSYRYSLPNKIFDYINAEVPVLVSDLPEFSGIIKSYSVGAILESRDAQSVARQITQLLLVPKINWAEQLLEAKQTYCWKNKEMELLSFFN